MNYSIFTDTMADLDWREIENKGRQKVPVLFPLGVIEEHGPVSYTHLCPSGRGRVPDNYYSFTLPITTPATKYFCRNGYTRRIGTVHNKIKAPLIPLPVTSIR